MAESAAAGGGGGEKGLGKALIKKIGRTKEKVMRKIGNADRTTDIEYDQLVELFTEQHNVASRLQKEVKNYMSQVKAMSVASQSMYEAIAESYEVGWKNGDKFRPAAEELITLWVDRVERLNNDLQSPLTRYADQFRDLKKKIEKRDRKLTDFDGKRHTVEALESAKKRDEVKITRAHEEMAAAKSIYETIHNELCEELPTLYQSRIPTLCHYFGSLVSSEATFQMECAKIKTRLAELIDGNETSSLTQSVVARSPAVKKAIDKTSSSSSSKTTPPRPPVVQRSIDHHPHYEPDKSLSAAVSETGDQSNEYLTLVEFGGSTTANRIDSDDSDDDNEENDERATVGTKGAAQSHSTDDSVKKAAAVSAASSITSNERLGGSNRDLETAAGNPLTFHSSNSSLDSNPKNASHTDRMIQPPLTTSKTSIDRKESKGSIEETMCIPADKESKEGEMGQSDGATAAAAALKEAAAAAAENGKESDDDDDDDGVGRGRKGGEEKEVHHHKSSSSDEEEKEKKKEKKTDGDDFLYKVVAIHSYGAEDADELSFDKGEVIEILPFEEMTEEQDEGWLFGRKTSTGQKGVFPINFTSRA